MNMSSSNPSDYQFLLRTLTDGNHVAKAQSLKRFNTLILSDKKQFAMYAKRIVIGIQDLMLEHKEDINLLACTLALEIVNLNPRDIEFYVKSKLLKPMVLNLGDAKPQIRKTSHYCLLAYIRTFKNFDDLIEAYINNGLMSKQWQLRQKSINSLQSILVMEMRYVDWSSTLFRRIFELLLTKIKDQNGFVQKASEQCLLSLSKVDELKNFGKRLNPVTFNMLKAFCEQQYELGNLNQIKLDLGQKKQEHHNHRYDPPPSPPKHGPTNQSISSMEKIELIRPEQKIEINKVAPLKIHDGPEQNSFRKRRSDQRNSLKKIESTTSVVRPPKEFQHSLNLRQIKNPQRDPLGRDASVILPPIAMNPPVATSRQEKMEQAVGKKLVEDLKNDKDWKARLQAVEELLTKYQLSKQDFEIDVIMKSFVPILIKLLGDSNFKVALVALKVLQQILHTSNINMDQLVPQIVQKLNDNKVALRQNISKLIKNEYSVSKLPIWLDSLLLHIKKTSNANIKEEVLNIFYKIYEDGNIPYSFQKILELICPLMDDLKTKIKIKTLDLLALVTIKSGRIDRAKNILASKMNQVYYEMYLQKIGKELKSMRHINKSVQKENTQKQRTTTTHMPRKVNKIGNTTSTSLQKYVSNNQTDQNSTVKTAFYQANQKTQTVVSKEDIEHYEGKVPDIHDNISDDQTSSVKKKTFGNARHLRRRNNKSIESRLSTTNYSNDDAFPPFHEPQKELKNIMAELKSDDWQIANDALTKMRRITKHHSQLLGGSVLKCIIPDIVKMTQSLRSSLSKNAVIVVNQLSTILKRGLDPYFDLIFSKLIKKALDTNSFISDEVKKALVSLCSNCNENKVMSSLHTSHTSRAIPIKIAVTNILEGITFLPRFYDKQLERIVCILNTFMGEGSLEIREKTKQLLNSIISSDNGPLILKYISNEHRAKLKKLFEPNAATLSQSKMESQIEVLAEQKKSFQAIPIDTREIYPRRKKKNKITHFPEQFEGIDSYLQNCQSSDWKVRLQNMSQIAQLCRKYIEEILQHKSNSKIMDILSKQINDPNTKVATNALKIFIELTGILPTLIEGCLSVIMNQIFICFSSMKPDVKILSEKLFDAVAENIEKWMLTQHLCNGALYSIQKSKPTIINKLTSLIPDIRKMKPNIFQKNVYQMINKVAEENKPELNGPLRDLLEILYKEVGQDCLSSLKQKAKALIYQ